MFKYYRIPMCYILGSLCSLVVHAAEFIPDVYQDEYLTVRAGILEIERAPIHFGDLLTLKVELIYDSDEIVIENLDEEFFNRNWAGGNTISLAAGPSAREERVTDNLVVVSTTFPFQVLGCPGEQPSCSGHRTYVIPIFSFGYQIIDSTGAVQNNKSVRFRPWPGYLMVTQSLNIDAHEGSQEFSGYFPGGGYPETFDLVDKDNPAPWFLFAGGMILLAGFMPLLLRNNVSMRTEVSRRSGKRWENILDMLEDPRAEMGDDRWVDLMRRCLVWYCIDEQDRNPYIWIDDDTTAADYEPELKTFFFEILNMESVGAGRREELLDRFFAITGTARSRTLSTAEHAV